MSTSAPVLAPVSSEEALLLKAGQLMLHMDFINSAARTLFSGARTATKAQVLVLVDDLEELKRRCDDAAMVKWPIFPTHGL